MTDTVLYLLLLVALIWLARAAYHRLTRAAHQIHNAIHDIREEEPQP